VATIARPGDDARLQRWQFQHAIVAIQNLYKFVNTEWAGQVAEGGGRPAQAAEAQPTVAGEAMPVSSEEFEERVRE
jgi:hypothetical protein